MNEHRHQIESETWIEAVEVARCYRIEVAEIEVWISEGLLRRARMYRGTLVLALIDLDSVATLVRLTRVVGLDPKAIRSLRDVGHLPGLP